MSYFDCDAPKCEASDQQLDLIIRPARKDLGEFSVARALPSPERKMVGPFIFFDHMGPAAFGPGEGIQVRPHPHIGIATITYLFDGTILHRDSLGFEQAIEPGAVNLMVAGKGIVHSERAGQDLDQHSRLHGIQSWMALPDEQAEREPEFTHYPAADIPELAHEDASIRLIIGTLFGASSPVTAFSDTIYAEIRLPADGRLTIPPVASELAVYLVDGRLEINQQGIVAGEMALARRSEAIHIVASETARLMLLGGEPVGDREIWWNFVASDTARIETAKLQWAEDRFPKIVGDDEFIPLPDS